MKVSVAVVNLRWYLIFHVLYPNYELEAWECFLLLICDDCDPSNFSKDNILDGCDVKAYFFIFFISFLRFCRNLEGYLGVTLKKNVPENNRFLLKSDEKKGKGSFEKLESLSTKADASLGP